MRWVEEGPGSAGVVGGRPKSAVGERVGPGVAPSASARAVVRARRWPEALAV